MHMGANGVVVLILERHEGAGKGLDRRAGGRAVVGHELAERSVRSVEEMGPEVSHG